MRNTVILHIPIHSIVDLITNSSSELFVFNGNTSDATVKRLLETIISSCGGDYNETSIHTYDEYRYKDSYIIPEGVNPKDLYFARIDNNDYTLSAILREFFTEVKLEWKD